MAAFLNRAWWRLRQWLSKSRAERRVAAARDRFWSEVAEGRREAESRSRP